ncbi:DUF551 domain-containing protein [Klebsiella aerogenes]|uniref:DUF551 domain-containing protein n=1 Tax=Klebsiella aerogenes TaxID=548 RepID=UPI00389A6664
MTKSTITRERLEKIKSWRETYGAGSNVMLPAEEAEELARIALTAMDSEPVAYAWVSRSGKKHLTRCEPEQWRDAVIVTPLYRHAQPAPELAAIVERLNLSGYEYEGGEVTPQNAAAIVDTLLQQLDDAVQCRNAQPAPECEPVKRFNADQMHRICLEANRHFDKYGAMAKEVNKLLGRTPAQPAPVVQCPYPCGWDNLNKLAIQDAALVARGLVEGEPTTEAQRQAAISNNDRLLKVISACRAAMLQELKKSAGTEAICRSDENVQVLHTKSPAQSDCCPAQNQGWISVSERMPPSRHEVLVGRWWGEKPRWCCKWATYIPGHPDAQSSGWLIPGASWTPTHWMPLPVAPREVK